MQYYLTWLQSEEDDSPMFDPGFPHEEDVTANSLISQHAKQATKVSKILNVFILGVLVSFFVIIEIGLPMVNRSLTVKL